MQRQSKVAVPIWIQTTDGAETSGRTFLGAGERLSDLANDSRTFLAIERDDGSFELVNKSCVARIRRHAAQNQEN